MNLDELQSPMTSVQLAKLLEKQHGIKIPVQKISARKAQGMLESVQKKITRFRNSSAMHVSEQNTQYTAMLMVEQVLSACVTEGERLNAIGTALGTAAKKVGHAAGYTPKYKYHEPTKFGDIKAAFKPKGSGSGYGSGSGTASSSRIAVDIDDLAVAAKVPPKTLWNLATKIPAADATPAEKAFYHLKKMGAIVHESRYLSESAMGEAEVILAAKDLADRIQDMVETLGKMVNEELPALTETVRDTMDAESADAFNSSALEALNSALETIRGTKDSLDSTARALAGEEGAEPAAEPVEPSGDEEGFSGEEPQGDEEGAEASDELLSSPAASSGGKSEPLGRGKR